MSDDTLMAVDTLTPVDETVYLYPNVRECERRGSHQVTLDHWPPRKQLHDKEPAEAVQCSLCGAHVIVTDPPARGIKVTRPEVTPPTKK